MTLTAATRLSVLAAITALGAVGVTLALVGLGLPFALAALLSAGAAGAVQFGVARRMPCPIPPGPTPPGGDTADALLLHCRTAAAALRHDLRGTLSPAMMISDRLVNHADPAVQKAGQIVVRSLDRATALLETNREALRPRVTAAPPAAPDGPAPR